jgi:peroxiredoxin
MVSPLPTPPEVFVNPGTPLKRFTAAIGLVVLLSIPVATVTFLHRAEVLHQLRPGDQIPIVSLRSLDSAEISFISLNGKGAVVIFFSVDCPRCQLEISNFDKLFKAFSDKVVFVGISSGNSRETKEFLNRRGIALPVFLDDNAENRKAFGVIEVPTLFLVKANGEIAYRGSGAEPFEARRRLLTDFSVDQGRQQQHRVDESISDR